MMDDPMAFVVIALAVGGAIFATAGFLNIRKTHWQDREIARMETEGGSSDRTTIPAE